MSTMLSTIETGAFILLHGSQYICGAKRFCCTKYLPLCFQRTFRKITSYVCRNFISTRSFKLLHWSNCMERRLGLVSALQVWSDLNRLDFFLRRCKVSGCCGPGTPSIRDLLLQADERPFCRVRRDMQHVLHQLLPPITEHEEHYLRNRKHSFGLTIQTQSLNNNNFILRMISKNLY